MVGSQNGIRESATKTDSSDNEVIRMLWTNLQQEPCDREKLRVEIFVQQNCISLKYIIIS